MEFDIKVRRRFVKGGVSRRRDDAVSNQQAFSTYIQEAIGPGHTSPVRKFLSRRVPSRDAS
jgi:hypothetical protein